MKVQELRAMLDMFEDDTEIGMQLNGFTALEMTPVITKRKSAVLAHDFLVLLKDSKNGLEQN